MLRRARTILGAVLPALRRTRNAALHREHAPLGATADFESTELREMPWMIRANLSRLVEQARCGSYSTFRFYSPDEFEEALSAFEIRVRATFDDPSAITAQNDHLLVLATRR